MSETSQIILGICVLILVYVLTRRFHGWKIKRAYMFIIKDLKRLEAFDPSSAVLLSYAKRGLFQMGTRDYRPNALEHLVAGDIVGRTDSGGYYLKNKDVGFPNSQ